MLTQKEQELVQQLIIRGASNEEIKVEIERYRYKSEMIQEISFLEKITKSLDNNNDDHVSFFELGTLGAILLIFIYIVYQIFKKKIGVILHPFYNSKKHSFLMNKWYLRGGIVLYILALICTGFLLYSLTGYMQSVIFIMMKTTSYIFIIHQVNCFIFLKIIIDFVVLGNKQK